MAARNPIINKWFKTPESILGTKIDLDKNKILSRLTTGAIETEDPYLWWSSIYMHDYWNKPLTLNWPSMDKAYEHGAPPVYNWYNRKKGLAEINIAEQAWEDWAVCGSPLHSNNEVLSSKLKKLRNDNFHSPPPIWLIFKQVCDTNSLVFFNELDDDEIMIPTKLDVLATPPELKWLIDTLYNSNYTTACRPTPLVIKVLDHVRNKIIEEGASLKNEYNAYSTWITALKIEYPEKIALIDIANDLRAPLAPIFESSNTDTYSLIISMEN